MKAQAAKNAAKPPKYIYTVHREESRTGGHYAHAVVRVYLTPTGRYHTGRHEILSIKWQSDADQKPAQWYCPHLELKCDSDVGLGTAEQLSTAARLARRFTFGWDPIPFIKSLEEAGIPRRIYDNRLDRYLAPDELAPPDVVAWIIRVDAQCVLKAQGRNDSEAQEAALKAFGERIANPQREFESVRSITDKLQSWLAAGRPVERDRWGTAPESTNLDDLLKPLGHPPDPVPEAATATIAAAA
jgi:hypothetical protein